MWSWGAPLHNRSALALHPSGSDPRIEGNPLGTKEWMSLWSPQSAGPGW